MKIRNFANVSAGAILGLGIMIAPASAELCSSASMASCTIDLTVADHAGLDSSAVPPWGTVTLNLVGNEISFDVQLASGYVFANSAIGTGSGFGFNSSLSSAPTLTLDTSTITPPAGYTLNGTPGATAFDGFGNFVYSMSASTPPPDVSDLKFEVATSGGFTGVGALVGGSTDSSGNNSLVPSLFVADVRNQTGNCLTSCFGDVGTAVPEPISYLATLLAGFGVLGWVTQRRKSSNGTA